MGGSKAPKPDPNIGRAAMLSADTGRQALKWAQEQAAIANQWADEDRRRHQTVFQPLEDRFIADSVGYDTPERRAQEAAHAAASVRNQGAVARDMSTRQMSAMGVNPNSGRFSGTTSRAALAEGLATVGAQNAAERMVEAEGRQRLGQAVSLGQGLAVNPGTSLGLATGTGASGYQSAMQGYGQQGSLLNQDYQNRLQQWQANNAASDSIWGGIGSLAGLGVSIWSDEKGKKNKRKSRGALKAVSRMRVDDWTYKEGVGDGKRHTGTYAQDFKRETGRGDGRSIPVVDAIGVTMGAVKELNEKVDRLARTRGARRA